MLFSENEKKILRKIKDGIFDEKKFSKELNISQDEVNKIIEKNKDRGFIRVFKHKYILQDYIIKFLDKYSK